MGSSGRVLRHCVSHVHGSVLGCLEDEASNQRPAWITAVVQLPANRGAEIRRRSKTQQLADRGIDAEGGHGEEALSDYEKLRKARIEANEAFLVPLGLGPTAPRLTAQRP